MKISSLTRQISFSKTLVASCSVIKKENIPFPCKVYSLSQKDDLDYFEKTANVEEWKNARYLCYLKDDLKTIDDDIDYSIYTLETETGECLGYSEIVKKKGNVDEILFLETVPSQAFSNSYRSTYKYIGETLLSFMVKKSQSEKASRVELHPSVSATSFYRDKCFFSPPAKDTEPFHISRFKYNKLIKQNEEHTHSQITFVG